MKILADMYEYADDLLHAAGYENYEISNWARPGHQSRHNLTYWRNLPYIGMGAGAYSSFDGKRFSDVRDPNDYIRILKTGRIPENVEETEQVGRAQAMSETAFLALRTAQGLHLPTLSNALESRLRILPAIGYSTWKRPDCWSMKMAGCASANVGVYWATKFSFGCSR